MNPWTLAMLGLVLTALYVSGFLLGIRLLGRKLMLRQNGKPLRRKVVMTGILTAAVIVGSLIGNGGDFNSPLAIYTMLLSWFLVVATIFGTVKKV